MSQSTPSPSSPTGKKLVIGIAAMESKSRSKPMRNILQRLMEQNIELDMVLFGDKVVLDEEVTNWPLCDFLIAFHSSGFPLQKAIDYVQLRKPVCINDLVLQKLLLDRRLVLRMLDAIAVPTPYRVVVDRDGGPKISDDVLKRLKQLKVPSIVQSSNSLHTSIEQVDEDTYRVGDKLIRKPFVEKPVDSEDHNIWIYYPQSQGGGVRKLFRKVANKSSEFQTGPCPVRTDGSYIYESFMNVDNAEDVKVYTVGTEYFHAETRKSPVVDGIVKRNADGKEMRYVTPLLPEEQEVARKVCTSFGQRVCGFDLLRADGRSYVIDVNGWSFVKGNEDYYEECAKALAKLFLSSAPRKRFFFSLTREPSVESQWRLKGYLSVFRHADRTPKQKLKFFTCSQPFVDLLNGSTEEVILKKVEDLKLVIAASAAAKNQQLEDEEKMNQLIAVLEKKSELPGTKVQVKPIFSKLDGLLERLQVVVKWGGEFTHAGKHHSKDLAENLRKDLMLLNREILSSVKVYSSSERRVLASADVFLKHLLDREDLPADFIEVRRDMLDDTYDAKEQMEAVKGRLQALFNPEHGALPFETPAQIGDPAVFVSSLVTLMKSRREIMKRAFEQRNLDTIQMQWCCQESAQLFKERWERLFRDFCDVEESQIDPSKVPELYDSLKYDALHNRQFMEMVFVDPEENPSDPNAPLRDMYHKAKLLFDMVAPREYGIAESEKLEIGVLTSHSLIKQVFQDLQTVCNASTAQTYLYFTKESHVHTLYNVIRLCLSPNSPEIMELDYLTQITFELYERSGGLVSSDDQPLEYSLRIGFSPGANDPGLIDTVMDYRHALAVAPRRWITDHIQLEDALKMVIPKLSLPQQSPRCSPKLIIRKNTASSAV